MSHDQRTEDPWGDKRGPDAYEREQESAREFCMSLAILDGPKVKATRALLSRLMGGYLGRSKRGYEELGHTVIVVQSSGWVFVHPDGAVTTDEEEAAICREVRKLGLTSKFYPDLDTPNFEPPVRSEEEDGIACDGFPVVVQRQLHTRPLCLPLGATREEVAEKIVTAATADESGGAK